MTTSIPNAIVSFARVEPSRNRMSALRTRIDRPIPFAGNGAVDAYRAGSDVDLAMPLRPTEYAAMAKKRLTDQWFDDRSRYRPTSRG
ncbi:hypothetical protein [Sphingomonas lacusdianchii]|uniref:hypothetical protein n=1 Tax=Sphingomonas lacusdianchii TaxID=2917992 RepID=UPI001F5A7431|nr:hypothetical protein [Sphingomonas sp. JXJ CY 53]